jgi:Protein of unknown function (DUF5818)
MKKHLAVSILAGFAFVAVMVVAGPAAAGGNRGWNYLNWWSEQPPTKCTITGHVERTDNGLSLVTSGGQKYILTGKDLSREVGDEVVVTGELSKMIGEKPEIAVKSFTLT